LLPAVLVVGALLLHIAAVGEGLREGRA